MLWFKPDPFPLQLNPIINGSSKAIISSMVQSGPFSIATEKKQARNCSMLGRVCCSTTWLTQSTYACLSCSRMFGRRSLKPLKVLPASKSRFIVNQAQACRHPLERTLVATASFSGKKENIVTRVSSGKKYSIGQLTLSWTNWWVVWSTGSSIKSGSGFLTSGIVLYEDCELWTLNPKP